MIVHQGSASQGVAHIVVVSAGLVSSFFLSKAIISHIAGAVVACELVVVYVHVWIQLQRLKKNVGVRCSSDSCD